MNNKVIILLLILIIVKSTFHNLETYKDIFYFPHTHVDMTPITVNINTLVDVEMTIVASQDATLQVNSGLFPGNWSVLSENVKQFDDRGYILKNIPKFLLGMKYYKGPCHSNKTNISITASPDTKIYILCSLGNTYDRRNGIKISKKYNRSNVNNMYTSSFPNTRGFELISIR